MNHKALFDLLVILYRSKTHPTRGELHAVSYLSALLGTARDAPLTSWGYSFSSTSGGVPYSGDLDDTVERALGWSLVAEENHSFALTEHGTAEYREIADLGFNRDRAPFVHASSDAFDILGPTRFVETVRADLDVSVALRLGVSRQIPSEDSRAETEAWFRHASERLGPHVHDLLPLALSWAAATSHRTSSPVP